MSILSSLKPNKGSVKNNKRLGRGRGSGRGSSAGKGLKGQKQRTGGKIRPGFEGGQMPLHRRIPKRGFNNHFMKDFCVVSLEDLLRVLPDGGEVNLSSMVAVGLASERDTLLKIIGNSEIKGKYNITADKVTETAWKLIEEKGGNITINQNVNEYATVTLGMISRKFPKKTDGPVNVDFEAMKSAGLIPEGKSKVSVIAVGQLAGKYNISANKISREATKILQNKGCKAIVSDPVNFYRKVDFYDLEKWYPRGGQVTIEDLRTRGILKVGQKMKLAGDGRVKAPYQVETHKVSAIARKKLEAFGGKIQLLD
ncbi:MAG: 50S ribosomal protein L15 [Deltaproteobacteria bacterium]|nr:50S ribosomal protein L15 [Deltaproteobacteria bacterium]